MTFNSKKFFQDHGIDFIEEGNKHCRKGWIQTHCVFCSGSRNYHLGHNISKDYWHCWRCRWKDSLAVISKLLGISREAALLLSKQYGFRFTTKRKVELGQGKKKVTEKKIENISYPIGLTGLRDIHIKFLMDRNFDPQYIKTVWDVSGFGSDPPYPNLIYRKRLFIPIYFKDKMVSYTTRDIIGKSKMKYLSCPAKDEAIHHKDILYGQGFSNVKGVVVVEGPTDVWRLGKGAVATFGTTFTKNQMKQLIAYKRVFLMFDSKQDDPNASRQSKKLAYDLSSLGIDVEIIELDEGDPADLPQDKADEIMRELLGIHKYKMV